MRVSHRQLIIRNTPGLKAGGVFLCAGIYSKIKYSKNNILNLLKVICYF